MHRIHRRKSPNEKVPPIVATTSVFHDLWFCEELVSLDRVTEALTPAPDPIPLRQCLHSPDFFARRWHRIHRRNSPNEKMPPFVATTSKFHDLWFCEQLTSLNRVTETLAPAPGPSPRLQCLRQTRLFLRDRIEIAVTAILQPPRSNITNPSISAFDPFHSSTACKRIQSRSTKPSKMTPFQTTLQSYSNPPRTTLTTNEST